MELYEHQKRFLENPPRKRLLHWDTGTGKTRAAVEWALRIDNEKLSPSERGILIICPKSVKQKWWDETADWITKSSYKGFLIYSVVTKEEFRKDWESYKGIQAIIVDEAHYFAGMKSQLTKNLQKFIKKNKVERVLLLTATAYMSTPWNIYVLAKHLGCKWSYIKFKDMFFEERYVGRKVMLPNGQVRQRTVPKVKDGIEEEIAKLVATIGDVVHITECADIPEQIFEVEKFGLNDKQKKAMTEIEDLEPLVRFTKKHQIENGILKGDEYVEDKFFSNDKLERIYDLVSENKKIAIVCRYNLQITAIFRHLQKLERKVLVINGSTKDKEDIVRQAESLDDVIVLINASCSEGYELPSIGVCVFASLSFSYKDYKQMQGRFLRLNKLKKNVYIHLVTKDGVDQAVYDSVMKKQDFDITIYAQDMTNY